MNGLGNRFKDEDYHLPKPLINILGKPMIFWLLDNLDLSEVEQVIVPYTSILDSFDFQTQIRERYKNTKFKFFPFNYPTRGAAETVYIALDNLDEGTLENPVMLMDCDTFYFENIIKQYKSSYQKNNIFYFIDKQEQPIYSYINTDNNLVKEIAEKNKISDNANCGVYCFASGKLLKKYCKHLLDGDRTQHGEFYISGVYQLMLADRVDIGATLVENFHCVGTPMQLKIFCENYPEPKKRRFCFDLDNTLVTKPRLEDDYSSCEPIDRNINFLKHLKSLGHHIIIYTARRMRTHKGNVNAVIKDIGKLTLDQLERFNIPYDEIQFGKPWADFYIDDLAVNCNLSLEKQIGYYNTSIKSRAFNQVEILNNIVIKSGQIDGERYYYKNIPNEIVDLFPKLLEETNDKIIIERIKGLNFSYLYTNSCLTESQFQTFLESLYRLHNIRGHDTTFNHKDKLLDRYKNYNYSVFNGHTDTLNQLLDFFDKYQQKESTVIHGDPVFTNILIDEDYKIKLIDMRGKNNENYTIYGDPIYDIAKVYQSLIGYDFILSNTPTKINYKLIDILTSWVKNRYAFSMDEVRKYTASLYFSLIPLHNDEKCQQYYQVAQQLLSK
jgi:capsule biosynthesis phosphatase